MSRLIGGKAFQVYVEPRQITLKFAEKLGSNATLRNNRIKSGCILNLSYVLGSVLESMLLVDPLEKPFSANC